MRQFGIAIDFIEITFLQRSNTITLVIRWILSIIIPILLILLEYKGTNITEIIYGFLGIICFYTNNTKKAKDYFIKIVSKYNNSYIGHKYLGRIYEKEGGLRKSLEEYSKVIEIKPEDFKSAYKVANLLNELDRSEQSIICLNELLKKKPDFLDATLLLGDIFYKENRQKEAINVYEQAIKYNPKNFEIYYQMGMSYTMLNDFQNAKLCYQKAAMINAENYNPYFYLGQICLIEGEIIEAEKCFMQSIQSKELETESYYKLAKLYMLRHDKENAIKFINVAIEEDKKYIKIANEEDIFIPIKSYFRYKVVDDEDIPKKEINLTQKEMNVIEHLDKTCSIVGRLNNRNIKLKEENNKKKERDVSQREENI